MPEAPATTSPNITASSFILTGLHPGASYRVSISVFADKQSNARGHDCGERITGPVTFSTPEVKPLASPTITGTQPLNTTHVQLTWSELDVSQRGGVIREHIVVFQRLAADQARLHPNASTASQLVRTQSNSTSYALQVPQTYVRYNVQVCASNSAGRGPCGTVVIVQTTEGGMLWLMRCVTVW